MAVGYFGAAPLEALSAGGVHGFGCAWAFGVGVLLTGAEAVVVVVSVVCTGALVVVAGGGVSIVLVVEAGGELEEQAARDKATTQRRGKGYCFIAGNASLTNRGIPQ